MIHFSREVAFHFRNGEEFNRGNSKVTVSGDVVTLELCNNIIAEMYNKNTVFITNAGWKSRVTKERLNTLLPGKVKITSKKSGDWFLNGKVWNGEFTQVLI